MVRRRWKKLDRHIGHLERDPSPAVLHRTRIVTKRCRAAVGAARPILGSGPNNSSVTWVAWGTSSAMSTTARWLRSGC
ncbi:MAG: CHAD domain-containing protein [Candidatus Microthrix sp.]|nr:CHAD domain-containing protein [Candidatus Microthrix sp.]